jgi:hypothetical protein
MMLEIIQRTEWEISRAQDQDDRSSSSVPELRRKERNSVIWLLSGLGLVPAGAVVLFPETWHQLPPGVQWASYLGAVLLFAAVCSLILNPGDEHIPLRNSAEARKGRKQRRLYQNGSPRGA